MPQSGLPYIKGLSKQLSRTYQSDGINICHQEINTLHSILVHLKDKTPKEHMCGTTCTSLVMTTRNTTTLAKRPFGTRFKEHFNLEKPIGVGDCCIATGHSVSMDNTQILAREKGWARRKVKEVIYNANPPWTGTRATNDNQIIPLVSELNHNWTSVHGQDLYVQVETVQFAAKIMCKK